jgi:hypothetical protein
VSDDHVLDFLDVVGFYPFGPLALSAHRIPFEDAGDSLNAHMALACCEQIILDGLQTVGYRVPLFEACHYGCAAFSAFRRNRLRPSI